MRTRNLIRETSLLVLALTAFQPAMAQDTAPAPAVGNDDDIIVTARRRAELAQDVPVAVSALTAEALAQKNISEVGELSTAFVGVVVTQNPNVSGAQAPFFTIRGQAQQETFGLVDPSVALYVDDVVVARANGANLGFFDLQSVEVARGPQGTLFGRNTTGGAVQVRSHLPTDRLEGYVEQTVGNYNSFTTEAVLNAPLSAGVRLRLAGQYARRDGYTTDVVLNEDIDYRRDLALRGALSIDLSPEVENTTIIGWARARDGGTPSFPTYTPAAFFGTALVKQQALGSIHKVYSGQPQYSDIDVFSATNITTAELGSNFTLKNIFGYRDGDIDLVVDGDGTDLRVFPIQKLIKQNQYSNELQLSGTVGALTFTGGAYFFTEHVNDQTFSAGTLTAGAAFYGPDPLIEPDDVLGYFPNVSNSWNIARNTSYALYFQGDYEFMRQLSVTVGIRQNWDVRKARVLNRAFQPTISTAGQTCRFTLDEDGNPATPETRPSLENCEFRGRATYSEPTYNISLNYKPTDDILVYLAHRHGYRSGGFGARASTEATLARTFRPERIDDVEFGFKADWHFGNAFLRTNLALYYMDFRDAQRFLQVSQAPPVTAAANAQKAHIQGSELEILFRPVPAIELSGFWAYTDGKFDKFVTELGVDQSPQPYPHTPRNTFNLTGRVYLPESPAFGKASIALTYYSQSSQDIQDYYASPILTDAGLPQTPAAAAQALLNNAAQILPGYHVFNLNFDWDEVLGTPLHASIYVDNLTNKDYLLPMVSINNVMETRSPAPPRTYGIRLRYSF